MIPPPPGSNPTYTPFPYTPLFRSLDAAGLAHQPVAPTAVVRLHGHDRVGARVAAARPSEAGFAEGEDPAVRGDEPVPASGGCGGHADDGLVELHGAGGVVEAGVAEREDPPVRSEEHTSELQSPRRISYA